MLAGVAAVAVAVILLAAAGLMGAASLATA
jgi:hypothetical protein